MGKIAITEKSSINDVLRCYPETIQVFEKYKMGCMECMGATDESIENGAIMHNIDSSILVKEINKLIKKK